MCVGACGSAVAGRSGVELAPLQIQGRKWRDCSKCHYLCKRLMHSQVFDLMLLSHNEQNGKYRKPPIISTSE